MCSLVIGDKYTGCGFNNVATTITDEEPTLTIADIKDIMVKLGIDRCKFNAIIREINLNESSVSAALNDILQVYRSRESNEATLISLILALEKCKLYSHADALRKKFKLGKSKPVNTSVSNNEDPVTYNFINPSTVTTTNQHNSNNESSSHESHEDSPSFLEQDTGSPLLPIGDTTRGNIYPATTVTINPHNIVVEGNNQPHEYQGNSSSHRDQTEIPDRTFRIFSPLNGLQQRRMKTAVILYAGLSVLGIFLFFYFLKSTDSIEEVTKQNDFKVNLITNADDEISSDRTKSDICNQINLTSRVEYPKDSLNFHELGPICLLIQSNELIGWSPTALRIRSEQVIEITFSGCVRPFLVAAILHQFIHVKRLTMVNHLRVNCEQKTKNFHDANKSTEKNGKTNLQNLMHINILNITNCAEILTVIEDKFIIPKVVMVKINDLAANSDTTYVIRALLKEVRLSIKVLDLLNVSWETSLFTGIDFELPSLYELRLDFLCLKANECDFPANIPLYVPNLKKLISEQGHLSLIQNYVVMQIQEVEYLKYSLRVAKHEQVIDLAIFSKHLHNLKYLYLYINFQKLSNCYIGGKDSLNALLILEIDSDCIFDYV